MSTRGLMIAATSSRSGKTTLTLGLARALKRTKLDVACAKVGPDYIDPAYHAAATGKDCVNLDGWAMSDERLNALLPDADLLLIEGTMGLFDGAPPVGKGSSADIAKRLNLPIVLVVDCASLSHSVAAIVAGFLNHDPELQIKGIILNHIGSDRHETMLRAALSNIDTPILGAVHRTAGLKRSSRHLGLLQAGEHAELEAFLDAAADKVRKVIDVEALAAIASETTSSTESPRMPMLGKRIAIASDAAFTFIYPHFLADWRAQGAEISMFSPLADEAPAKNADAIFLPGGYPELFAQDLARSGNFRSSMKKAATQNVTIYGECGGFMVLGQRITDRRNIPFPMLGLLDLETSFAKPKLHLGYRTLTAKTGPLKGTFKAHEFHYSSVLHASGTPLFQASNASDEDLGNIGLVSGTVSGSFAHIIDRA